MKKLAVFGILLGLLSILGGEVSRADDLSYAVRVALSGPDTKDLDILGHEWNMKQATVQRRGPVTLVTGQISHRMAFSRDDQVYYQIFKRGDRVDSIRIKISARNNFELLQNFSRPVALALSAYIGVPVPPGAVDSVLGSINQVSTHGWRDAAALIVAHIAFSVR